MAEPALRASPALFPLFEGGPFSRLHTRLGLGGTEEGDVRRRIIAAVLLTWVPLAVLAVIQGRAVGPDWRQSMLLDPAMCARFLVAVPLLIAATQGLQRSVQTVVPHFLGAGLVKESEREAFLANIAGMLRWRDSWVAAVVMVALAIGDAVALSSMTAAEMPGSWRFLGAQGEQQLSLAGWWLVVISGPLFDLVRLQFLYRVLLWWGFLWRTSRLNLDLHAAHVDGAGGLAFLATVFSAFRLPLFAMAASAAGTLANVMLWTGASFKSSQTVIAAFVGGLVALVAGPLLFFNGQLRQVKKRAVLAWGASVGRQLGAFENKWLKANPPAPGEMLSALDFSAVDSFGQAATGVYKMSKLPFGPRHLVPLVVAALLPFLPVATMEIPLKDILAQVWKLVA